MLNINEFFENVDRELPAMIAEADRIGDEAIKNFTEKDKKDMLKWTSQL